MAREEIFSRRVLIPWALAAVAIFAASVYLLGRSDTDTADSTGPTVESRSALGFAGIADILEQLGTPVIHTRYRSREKLGDGGVLVIAEPRLDLRNLIAADKLMKAKAVLLVLPKWVGVESQDHSGWIGNADLAAIATVQMALDLTDARAEFQRGPGIDRWDHNEIGPRPVVPAPAQFIISDKLRPVVAQGDHILVGEMKTKGRRVFVLADPDVLSNRALENPANAAFAVALLGALRTGDGPVVFDESLNSLSGNGPNIIDRLFKPPLLPGSLLTIMAAILLLWATMPRFGAADPPAPALESGKRGLIDNIASLVGFSGRRGLIATRFVEATVQDVARRLHAPRGLAGDSLTAWLDRVGRARGVTVDCAPAVEQANELTNVKRPDSSALMSMVQTISRWKQEIINGPARHQKHR